MTNNSVPWNSPLRHRNLEYMTGRVIPWEELQDENWIDITSRSDPQDARIWIKGAPRTRQIVED
jgi:hypothetical protein